MNAHKAIFGAKMNRRGEITLVHASSSARDLGKGTSSWLPTGGVSASRGAHAALATFAGLRLLALNNA